MKRDREIDCSIRYFFFHVGNEFESVIGDVLRARRHARSGVKREKVIREGTFETFARVRFIITGKETLELGRRSNRGILESFLRYKTLLPPRLSPLLPFPAPGILPAAKSSFKPVEKPAVLSVSLEISFVSLPGGFTWEEGRGKRWTRGGNLFTGSLCVANISIPALIFIFRATETRTTSK